MVHHYENACFYWSSINKLFSVLPVVLCIYSNTHFWVFAYGGNHSFRSSHPNVFCKKGVLRSLTKFTGKHLHQSLFFNKVAGRNFIKKETLVQVFSCEFCETSKNTFLDRTLLVAASDWFLSVSIWGHYDPYTKVVELLSFRGVLYPCWKNLTSIWIAMLIQMMNYCFTRINLY